MRTQLFMAAAFALSLVAASSLHAQSRNRALTTRRALAPQSAVVSRPASPAGNLVVKELADLAIAKVFPDEDGRAPRTVTIVNQGGTTAAGFTIRVRAITGSNTLLYQIDIPVYGSLSPGASRTYRLFTTNAAESWSIHVDSRQRVRESNERNNFWSNNRLR